MSTLRLKAKTGTANPMTANNGAVIAGIVLVCFGGGISLIMLIMCSAMGGMAALCG